MNIEHALTIDGWMAEVELLYLSLAASKRMAIAEIGSWMGRSTSALAANCPGTVWAIDTWAGTANEAIHSELIGNLNGGSLLDRFQANTARYTNIQTCQRDSQSAAAWFAQNGQKFDMIFINTDCGNSK